MSEPGPSRSRPEDEPIGTLVEEAVKLLGALGDWARDQGAAVPGDLGAAAAGVAAGVAGHAAAAARDADTHLDTGAAACTWCPLCRTVHAVRQTSPEVRDQLLVAATALLQAGTGLLAAFGASRGDGASGAGPRVERIDLDDVEEDLGKDLGEDLPDGHHDSGAGTGPDARED